MQRLDRCLANIEWLNSFPNTSVFHLPLLYSDPILAKIDTARPCYRFCFKFENWWLRERDFGLTVSQAWASSTLNPFALRLKQLSDHLCAWSKKKKPLQQQLAKTEEDVLRIQESPNRHNLIDQEIKLSIVHDALLQKLSDYYKQRAKLHWSLQGDRNTAFFQHNQHETHTKPKSPSQQDILNIIKNMKTDAAPGPDGFNSAFYVSCWDWIKHDVTTLIHDFYTSQVLPPGINSTNIVLIPKKHNPCKPEDFRPISLCNVIYKIIAKSLAIQIREKIADCIDGSQQAFIKGRRASTNLIVVQEILHSFKLSSFHSSAFLLKLDLSKAFDRLEWKFIAHAMLSKGFDPNFINLVLQCISTPSFSVILNGKTTGHFTSQRGLRQGCPLSPYLFVLSVNVLAEKFQEQASLGHIKGIKLNGQGPTIHALFYADDIIITGQANASEASAIRSLLNDFCKICGQTPNWLKSSVIFSSHTSQSERDDVCNFFPVQMLNQSNLYLGNPIYSGTQS
uniref:Reverse transcriptase domain-containing protein n=1 Tax=Oryza brachyantha TaxID=4533 RepID=J3N6X5_ORYBR